MNDNTLFLQQLLRLKLALNVSTDKDVAKALGISPTGFNERKKRGSFPVDRLRAVVQQNPQWALDVDYVLHGSTDESATPMAASARVQAIAAALLGAASTSRDTIDSELAELRQRIEQLEHAVSKLTRGAP